MTKIEFYDIATRIEAGEAAQKEISLLAAQSRLERRESDIHALAWSDIQKNRVVGVGGFSRVYEVHVDGRASNIKGHFALKCLNAESLSNEKKFKTGALDLAAEGEILSRLQHENIIQIHGVSAEGPLRAFKETPQGYFLLLEFLEDTLQNKLNRYRQQRKVLSLRSRSTSHSSVVDRLQNIALGVAKGLEYLHIKGVAMRDLKPDNIGFDKKGTPKIFDLGFAREVHTVKDGEIAGSLRYMAPEVALGLGTTLKSDVYSFGVLLWEICTMEKPYKRISGQDEFMESVICGESYRLSMSLISSEAIRRLIDECMNRHPDKRPDMTRIVKILLVETALSNCTCGGGDHTRKQLGSSFFRQSKRNVTFNCSTNGAAATVANKLGQSFGSIENKFPTRRNASWANTKKLSSSSFTMLKSLSRNKRNESMKSSSSTQDTCLTSEENKASAGSAKGQNMSFTPTNFSSQQRQRLFLTAFHQSVIFED